MINISQTNKIPKYKHIEDNKDLQSVYFKKHLKIGEEQIYNENSLHLDLSLISFLEDHPEYYTQHTEICDFSIFPELFEATGRKLDWNLEFRDFSNVNQLNLAFEVELKNCSKRGCVFNSMENSWLNDTFLHFHETTGAVYEEKYRQFAEHVAKEMMQVSTKNHSFDDLGFGFVFFIIKFRLC